ncbi:MAG: hypothetical protein KAS26_03095 [Sulfurimonas sp.]|nr:hypothetical protein [Sulfurimonas sp.]
MREFKFRAWLEIKNEYGVQGMFKPSLSEYNDMDDEISNSQEDGIVFMQYTGLKDKNGVEIYEGDMLVFDYDEDVRPFYGVVKYAESGCIFDGGYFLVDTEGFATDYAFEDEGAPSEWQYLTVIGNIYENKELLDD